MRSPEHGTAILTIDFSAFMNYICEYHCNYDTGVVKNFMSTLEASDCDDLKDQMKLLRNTWIHHRQMSEAEAVFKLTKKFHFRESVAKCVFVQTCPGNERSKILKNVTDKPEFRNMPKIAVDSHKGGEYIEQYDLNSKYDLRDREENAELKLLSFSQMVKMYEPFWGRTKDNIVKNTNMDDDEPCIVVYNGESY